MVYDKQVKSKKRVADHGEVFTAEREVNAMLDLVKQESERIDSRFLEPACGTGNFLAAILKRKLNIVEKKYKDNQFDFELYSFIALTSIYGVELLQDNVTICKNRLYEIFKEFHLTIFNGISESLSNSAKFVLNRNILWGDALSLKTPDNRAEPIIFSEWSMIGNGMIKRRDFTMANLLDGDLKSYNEKKYKEEEIPLFSDEGDPAFLPTPVAEFPVIHFLRLGGNIDNKLQP